jgi:hypothetical protein
LSHLRRVRRRTRLRRQGFWFPLVVFGVAMLASAPLYSSTIRVTDGPRSAADNAQIAQILRQAHLVAPDSAVAGAGQEYSAGCSLQAGRKAPTGGGCGLSAAQAHRLEALSFDNLRVRTERPGPLRAAVFWLLAGTAGYVLTVGFYRRRARRRGVATPVRAYVLTGVGLLVAVAATTAAGVFPLGDLVVRQMVPLLTIGVGFLVLARVERSWPLATTSVAFIAAVFLTARQPNPAAAYGLVLAASAEVTPWLVAILGTLLLLAGGAFALTERIHDRRA